MGGKPLVSVCVITYNHISYIEKCLDSILAQHASFEIEILVHDDASTDGTVEILQKYENKYPGIFRVFYEKENQYQKDTYPGGYTQGLLVPSARGEYIAACEGDDYWADVNKLQKQVDYLQSHPECVLVCHAAVVVDGISDEKLCRMGMGDTEHDLSSEEIIANWNVPTASWLYRKSLFVSKHIDWPATFPVGDFPSVLYASATGRVHYFPDEMSVYRYQVPGSWTSSLNTDNKRVLNAKRWLEMYETIDQFTGHRWHSSFIEASHPLLRTVFSSEAMPDLTVFVKEAINSLCFKDWAIVAVKRCLRFFGYAIEPKGFGKDEGRKLVRIASRNNQMPR